MGWDRDRVIMLRIRIGVRVRVGRVRVRVRVRVGVWQLGESLQHDALYLPTSPLISPNLPYISRTSASRSATASIMMPL